jgi:hypothetical protein
MNGKENTWLWRLEIMALLLLFGLLLFGLWLLLPG